MTNKKLYEVRLYKKVYQLTQSQVSKAYIIMHSLILLSRGVQHEK